MTLPNIYFKPSTRFKIPRWTIITSVGVCYNKTFAIDVESGRVLSGSGDTGKDRKGENNFQALSSIKQR